MRNILKIIILFSFFFHTLQVNAAQPKIFSVSDIDVTIPKDELTAKPFQQAVRLGQRQAFDKLLLKLSRVTMNKEVKDADIGALIARVQVTKELKNAHMYKAKLNYIFSAEKTLAFLDSSTTKATSVAHLPKTTLVIPVLSQADGQIMLWEENNPWRQAWLNAAAQTPAVLPFGDAEDMMLIKAAEAQNLDQEKLKQLMAKYKCTNCVVAHAKMIFATSTEHSGNFTAQQVSADGKAVDPLNLKAANKDLLFQDAIKSLQPQLQQVAASETSTAFQTASSGPLFVKVPFQAPGDYYKIEDCLKKISMIQRIETQSLEIDQAVLSLACTGDMAALSTALAEQQLALQDDKGQLKLVKVAAEPSSPLVNP